MPLSRSSVTALMAAPYAATATAPPTEIRLTPSSASSPTVGAPGRTSTLTGTVDGGEQLAEVAGVDHPWGEEDVGAGLLVRLQTGDGVGQVAPAVQVVLGPGGQDEGDRARVGGLGGGADPLGGVGQLVDGGVPVTA